jgi:NADH-quinone oxidoreductase subunit E
MQLSKESQQEIDTIVARYPNAHAAVLPVMHVVQREHGHISAEAQAWVAERLDMPLSKTEEVMSFYTMLHREPMGTQHLQVCRSLSCYLRGEGDLTDCIRRRLDLAPGGKTADGKFSLEMVECLGSCGTAPVVQVNDDYHEDLTPERLEELLEEWSR